MKIITSDGRVRSEIVTLSKSDRMCPIWLREVKRDIKNGIYTAHTLKPLYCVSDLIIHDNDFGLMTEPENKITIYVLTELKDRLIRRAMREYAKRRKTCGKMATVYGLVRNSNLFYIGVTKNKLKTRLWHHWRFYNNSAKMKEMHQGAVSIVSLCECPVEFQFKEERKWINSAKANGIKLTNIV